MDWSELSWDLLRDQVIGGARELFAGSRNKLKDLEAMLEEGPEEVERLLRLRPLEAEGRSISELNFVKPPYHKASGFRVGSTANAGRQTPLVDALELEEFYLPFTPTNPQEVATNDNA
jgi:hypothetical protein